MIPEHYFIYPVSSYTTSERSQARLKPDSAADTASSAASFNTFSFPTVHSARNGHWQSGAPDSKFVPCGSCVFSMFSTPPHCCERVTSQACCAVLAARPAPHPPSVLKTETWREDHNSSIITDHPSSSLTLQFLSL